MVLLHFRRNILSFLILLGIVTVLVAGVGFAIILNNFARQTRESNALTNNLGDINALIMEVMDVNQQMDAIIRNGWRSEDIAQYMTKSRKLESLIYDYGRSHKMSSDSVSILRRLAYFNDYQMQLVESSESGREYYENSLYIEDAFMAHMGELYGLYRTEMEHNVKYYADMEKSISNINLMAITFVLFFFLFSCYVYFKFVYDIRSSITKAIVNLGSLSEHDWNVEDLPLEGFSEFISLFSEINQVKRELYAYFLAQEEKSRIQHQLMEQQLKNEKQQHLLVSTEMEMLKAQVNPHFIFNALHQIGMATLMKEPDEVMEIVENVGNILRYIIYNKDSLVELEAEIDIVGQYVELQRLCLDASIGFSVEMEENCRNELICPMCIQPVVENCFKHAMSDGRDHLNISMTVSKDAYSVNVAIMDDGVGILDPSKVFERESEHGIGLSNIRRRLLLQYGVPDLVTIESNVGEYTSVKIRFPFKEAQNASFDC